MPRRKKSRWWLLPLVSSATGLALYAFRAPIQHPTLSHHVGDLMGHTFFWVAILPAAAYGIALIPGGIYWLFKRKQMPHISSIAWVLFWLYVIISVAAAIDERNSRSPDSSQPNKQATKNSTSELYKRLKGSVFAIVTYDSKSKPTGFGSGVAIENELVATNCHVIQPAESFSVIANEKKLKGKLYSQHGDLCIIYLQGSKLKPVSIRLSKDVEVGEDVYAIGNPKGLIDSISKGVLSKKDSMIEGVRHLQTDAVVASGSSGGGLFDSHGNLIGITTLVYRDATGLTFAIPSEIIYAAILEPIVPGTDQHKEHAKSHSKNKLSLKKIRSYGKDKVSLYQYGDSCFMVFKGKNKNQIITSLSIWLPEAPKEIFIFPSSIKIKEAFTYFARFLISDSELARTKNYLFLDDQGFPLLIDKTVKGYNKVQVAVINQHPLKLLVDGEYFLVELIDPSSPNGYRELSYGLYGFTEALTAYHTHCDN